MRLAKHVANSVLRVTIVTLQRGVVCVWCTVTPMNTATPLNFSDASSFLKNWANMARKGFKKWVNCDQQWGFL
jgi:hypothetical protein